MPRAWRRVSSRIAAGPVLRLLSFCHHGSRGRQGSGLRFRGTQIPSGRFGSGIGDAAREAKSIENESAAVAPQDMVADVEEAGPRRCCRAPSKTRRGQLVGRPGIFRIDDHGGYLAVVGDGETDLIVTDENGNLSCKDGSSANEHSCAWTPRWSGVIAAMNRGLIRTANCLLTNTPTDRQADALTGLWRCRGSFSCLAPSIPD